MSVFDPASRDSFENKTTTTTTTTKSRRHIPTFHLVFSVSSVSLEEVLVLQACSWGTGNSNGHIPNKISQAISIV